MSKYKIKNINRNRRKNPRYKMQVDNKNIFQLEEIKRKRREQLIRKKRRQKEKEKSSG